VQQGVEIVSEEVNDDDSGEIIESSQNVSLTGKDSKSSDESFDGVISDDEDFKPSFLTRARKNE
jgi:hypothetical protein